MFDEFEETLSLRASLQDVADVVVDVVQPEQHPQRRAVRLAFRLHQRVELTQRDGVLAQDAPEAAAQPVVVALRLVPADVAPAASPRAIPYRGLPVAERVVADHVARQHGPDMVEGLLLGHAVRQRPAPAHEVIQLVRVAAPLDDPREVRVPREICLLVHLTAKVLTDVAQIAAHVAPDLPVFVCLRPPGADALDGRKDAADHVPQLFGIDLFAHWPFSGNAGRRPAFPFR
ncbi:MAG TPA: hypothetical protein VEU30_00985 [Thermoanaerobaculia bacterium]|nr:hypothetical protein [Thermoanaerobaculia bacterium]